VYTIPGSSLIFEPISYAALGSRLNSQMFLASVAFVLICQILRPASIRHRLADQSESNPGSMITMCSKALYDWKGKV
jgi:hypothetical protein